MSLLGDVNVNAHGLRDILKFNSTLNAVLFGKLKCNYMCILYLIVYCSFLFAFHSSKFCNIALINFVKVFFAK